MIPKPLTWHEQALLQTFDRSLVLYRQPIIHVPTGKTRYEILVRHLEANGDIRSGAEIIQECERLDTIVLLDLWVIGQMVSYLCQCPSGNHYSVNLSPYSFASDRAYLLICGIWEKLSSPQVTPHNLGFELTERGAIDWKGGQSQISSLLQYLRAEGYYLALDDFGAGHTIADLVDFVRPTAVKIDGSFIKRVESCDRTRELVRLLVQIAKIYGITVVAESVETMGLLDLVYSLGCEWVQGWAVGYPEPLPLTHSLECFGSLVSNTSGAG